MTFVSATRTNINLLKTDPGMKCLLVFSENQSVPSGYVIKAGEYCLKVI